MAAIDEAGDIQAIVDRGFGSLAGASYILLQVEKGQAASAKDWLAVLPVTSLARAESERLEQVVQLAFTASGLAALGFDPEAAGGFAPEFLEGMAGSPRKSAQLGDVGTNAPEQWAWGIGAKEPHLLVILLAPFADIGALETAHVTAATAAGCKLVCANRSNGVLGHEPFGFADGLSQPEPDWKESLVPGQRSDRAYRNCIAAGEFLLGHANEYGFVPDYPQSDEVGRNGSYLVYRQMEQHVRRFWTCLAGHVGREKAVELAELMVGRGINGDPLASLRPGPKNDFTYSEDPDGICCPIGAHIRRANPRSGDDPNGDGGFIHNLLSLLGLKGSARHDAVASARFHRLLRRGRSYGPVVEPAEAMSGGVEDEEEAGLHFICLNASLARQFEFVQGAWVASAYFGGLSCEQDAILGNRTADNGERDTAYFTYADAAGSPRIVSGLPQFVTVRGGAYFFLPGLAGLKRIIDG